MSVSQTTAQHVFYQNLIPVTDNSIDIGTALLRFKDLYLSGNVILTTTNTAIRTNTIDGADNLVVYATAGGAVDIAGSRGAVLELAGNEATGTGRFQLRGGLGGGTCIIANNGNAGIEFRTNALACWSISAIGRLEQNTTNGNGIIMGRTGSSVDYILNGAASLDADVTNITGTHVPFVGVQTAGGVGSQMALIDNGNDASGVQLQIFKTRSGGTNANTIVQDGDIIGEINFRGADGAAYRNAASIRVKVDGTPNASDLPGRIEFLTTLDGAASSTLRWTLDNAGLWQNNTAGNESTGANTVVLTNSPATNGSAPYVWIKMKSSDGSTVYMPVWK